jgi:hypothetical protein
MEASRLMQPEPLADSVRQVPTQYGPSTGLNLRKSVVFDLARGRRWQSGLPRHQAARAH